MYFNLYIHLIMQFSDTVLSQISILQTLTCMVSLMYVQPHHECMDVKLEWSGFHRLSLIVMFALFIPTILWYSFIDFFFWHSAFISNPILYLNLEDSALRESNTIKTKRFGLPKEKKRNYPHVIEAYLTTKQTKKHTKSHLTSLESYFMVTAWNLFGITMTATHLLSSQPCLCVANSSRRLGFWAWSS